jgi:NAD(P)-dependent dehydrogenase (short-subunit alcohol dehydrogenase family)
MMRLAGRVAIVTGASRGVGKGVAVELGAAGATVYVTGRTLREGDASLPGTIGATADAVAAAGGRGIAIACDHRDDAAVEALFARVAAEQGRLDLLVNNAFAMPSDLTSQRPFYERPVSDWDVMIDVGTRSAYVASVFAARAMLPAGRGLIVNVSSSGAVEHRWHVVYGVGKAALDRITADTALELAPHGIAVVSVWPGLVLTERTERAREVLPQLDFEHAESPRFTGRAVVALASDPEVRRFSGRAVAAHDLALGYGFRDVDGRLPAGPIHFLPPQPRTAQ